MADEDDLNPNDRGALKRAADDILKAARSEERRQRRAGATADGTGADGPDGEAGADGAGGADGRDEWDELLDRVTSGSGGPGGPEAAPGGAPSEALVAARERLAAIEGEAEEAKDRALRMAAEMENLRRRTQREVQDAKAFSISGFARDMLEVADNLTRALEAVPEGSDDPALIGLKEGVEMTGRALDRALEKHGVRKLEPAGEKFDPNFHQAMFKVPDPAVPANSVVQVVQAGYAIGPRVLRPAMVGVAEGGPKFADEGRAGEPGAGPATGDGGADGGSAAA